MLVRYSVEMINERNLAGERARKITVILLENRGLREAITIIKSQNVKHNNNSKL